MKTYKIIIALVLFSIVLSSCTKGIIKELLKEEEVISEIFVADDGGIQDKTIKKDEE